MAITRLSLDGYGAKRAGSFAGKGAAAAATGNAANTSIAIGIGITNTGMWVGQIIPFILYFLMK